MRQVARKWKWVVIESGHYIYNEDKSPLYSRGRVLDPATNSMKLRVMLIFEKFEHRIWVSNYIPIDAEFCADFKNVYLYTIIFYI